MGDYWKWQPEGGPVVRVHRRVMAGLGGENAAEFRGILLGTVSPATNEVVVEDYERLPSGAEFDPVNGSIAGQNRHSLPAVGYFRVGPGDELRITGDERERFETHFPGPLHVLLLFRGGAEKVEPADAYAQPGVFLRVAEPVSSEADAGRRHRVLFREGESTRALDEPAAPRPRWRRHVWPVVAVAAGFVIGAAAYLTTRSNTPRDSRPTATKRVLPPGMGTPADPAPVTPVANGAFEASRSADGGGVNAVSRAEVEKEIRVVLGRWRSSLLGNDIDGYVNLYSPSVETYFTKSRVSRAEIGDEVRRTRSRYGALTVYNISDINIVPVDESHAIASFRKRWRTANNNFAGDEKAQLRFARQNGNWAITSEKELKVYWVRKR